jgi:hypothetical protein
VITPTHKRLPIKIALPMFGRGHWKNLVRNLKLKSEQGMIKE